MKPDSTPNAPLPGQQLLFDWTQVVGGAAESQVTSDSEEARNETVSKSAPVHSASSVSNSSIAPDADSPDELCYPPNHPWHYMSKGDNAAPIPFDEIPPAADYEGSVARDLPRSAARRIAKARQLLERERQSLDEAHDHYVDVILRGVEALSRYDREMAYGGNDELARAGTLALLYNQIAWRKGRIAYLERFASKTSSRTR